ncbi:hypothetical protein CA13_17430 [Planctomycetes bacterium CA13]|uniref:Uncharacterized protein n=1 Tax=Novipirellula herctigrandis TaxID=2527986 RepID=A0A5C5YZG0_9BACT|nr:hypothetical protein CA13_17430 [Planctomycetes bacterium CA13]
MKDVATYLRLFEAELRHWSSWVANQNGDVEVDFLTCGMKAEDYRIKSEKVMTVGAPQIGRPSSYSLPLGSTSGIFLGCRINVIGVEG